MIHERKLSVLGISLAVSVTKAVTVCWKAHKCLHAPLLGRVLEKCGCMYDDKGNLMEIVSDEQTIFKRNKVLGHIWEHGN